MARAAKRGGPRPLSIYPGDDVRNEIARIGREDHGRPLTHVAVLALKAFAVLYGRDKYEALKLADAFGKPAH